ncbi:MAG: hypothetical protein R6V13_10785 [Anaerolineae bacterium]
MFTLRCTRKLLNFLDIEPVEAPEPPTGALGDWYANLIPTCAGDLVIFVNERSLVTVAVPVWEVEDLVPLFRIRVRNLLAMMGLPWDIIEREIGHLDPVQFAKTASRSVLGCMNDTAWGYQVRAEQAVTEGDLRLSPVELKLSQMLFSPLDYRFPTDVAEELLMERYGREGSDRRP